MISLYLQIVIAQCIDNQVHAERLRSGQPHTGEKSGSSGESIGDTSSREDETHQNSYGEGESGEEDCCYRRAEAEDSRRLQGEAWAWEISHHIHTLTSKKRDRERRKNGYHKMITSDVEKKNITNFFVIRWKVYCGRR